MPPGLRVGIGPRGDADVVPQVDAGRAREGGVTGNGRAVSHAAGPAGGAAAGGFGELVLRRDGHRARGGDLVLSPVVSPMFTVALVGDDDPDGCGVRGGCRGAAVAHGGGVGGARARERNCRCWWRLTVTTAGVDGAAAAQARAHGRGVVAGGGRRVPARHAAAAGRACGGVRVRARRRDGKRPRASCAGGVTGSQVGRRRDAGACRGRARTHADQTRRAGGRIGRLRRSGSWPRSSTSPSGSLTPAPV